MSGWGPAKTRGSGSTVNMTQVCPETTEVHSAIKADKASIWQGNDHSGILPANPRRAGHRALEGMESPRSS